MPQFVKPHYAATVNIFVLGAFHNISLFFTRPTVICSRPICIVSSFANTSSYFYSKEIGFKYSTVLCHCQASGRNGVR